MALRLGNITFDCDDTLAVARFWSAVLDRPIDPEASEFFATIDAGDDSTPSWFFGKVPEPKTAKNRCHVDLRADDRDAVAVEVERLVALGATVIRDPKEDWGHYWATLQDPEKNEFGISAPRAPIPHRAAGRGRAEGSASAPPDYECSDSGSEPPCDRPGPQAAGVCERTSQNVDVVRCRVVVHGRVQGVWFRETCRREAVALGVAGWVRNNRDGTVEAVLEGATAAVEKLVGWMRTGPPRARVTAVETYDEPATGERTFTVL